MKFIKLSIKFIKRYFLKRPIFTIVYGFAYFAKYFSFKYIYFYNKEEIKKEIQKGKSLIRFGDGEVSIMNGGSTSFQPYKKLLADEMLQSIKKYNRNSNYILCINQRIFDKTNEYLKKVNQFRLWLPMKVYYFIYFNKKMPYFDASHFYKTDSFGEIFFDYLKTRKVLFVLSEEDKIKMKDWLLNKFPNAEFLGVPPRNSFASYDDIQIFLFSFKEKNITAMLACGPVGKVLAFKNSNKIQCIDIGFGLEVYFEGKGKEHMISI